MRSDSSNTKAPSTGARTSTSHGGGVARRKPGPKPRKRSPDHTATPKERGPGQLYDLHAWCADACLSKSTVYKLWAQGKGPQKVMIGAALRIIETPMDYAKRMQAAQGAE